MIDRRYGVIENQAIKNPCITATTGSNITLSGLQTIDGVVLVDSNRVLVKDQTDQTTNGIYLAHTSAWTRDLDFDGNLDVVNGTFVPVATGSANAKTLWQLTSTDPVYIDGGTPSNITFAQVFTNLVTTITAAPAKNPPVDADKALIVDSVTSLPALVTWANIKAALAALTTTWGISTTGNAATATNVTGYTASIASGGSSVDIWTATGNVIQMTGVGTTTGFAAAPSIGSQRKIVTTGACLFTAGANLIIEGIPSGASITMQANAILDVLAITTTQFKITYHFSGSFTATGTGFSANPTTTALYTVDNGWCKLQIPTNSLTGTSNATTFTITGFPAAIAPQTGSKRFLVGICTDNGVVTTASFEMTNQTLTIYKGTVFAGSTWTNSGTKNLYTSEFVYSLN